MDEPFADFSGGESADVEKAQCGNRSEPLESNSSIQGKRRHEAARKWERQSRCGFVRKNFRRNRSQVR